MIMVGGGRGGGGVERDRLHCPMSYLIVYLHTISLLHARVGIRELVLLQGFTAMHLVNNDKLHWNNRSKEIQICLL